VEPRRSETPMMRQHRELKRQAGDALLFFRMGDFYELFEADAEKAAPLLDLVLTSREKDTATAVPMCGVPFHALEGYVRRCLAAGLSVAIAEQTEDPRQAKGLVRREIVEIVTPGLVANADRLEGASANYLGAVIADAGLHGFAYLDLSTGEFAATETERREVFEAEVDRIAPRELVAREVEKELPPGVATRRAPDADFDPRAVEARVGRLPHGLDAHESGAAARAAAALYATVAKLQPGSLDQLGELRRYRASEFLTLDRATRRHLELFENAHDGGREGTLVEALDETRSPLGRRRLATWLGEPLLDAAAIRARQDKVAAWLEPDSVREGLRAALRTVGDLERALSRATLATGGPRELAQLRACLRGVARVAEAAPVEDPLRDVCAELERVLVDDPPQAPRGEPHVGYVRDGVDAELDEIRRASLDGESYFTELEARERARTGIPTLKVRYNRVFGWSIEVTKARLGLVPSEYRRKQTTVSGERYTTDELERWEGVTLRARERAAAAELRVLDSLRARLRASSDRVRRGASEIAELDVAQSLATVARERGWVRPELDGTLAIEIEAGRHPVVERRVRDFVANDVRLDGEGVRFLILTGPNMAGKSTLLRQVALIALLAQMGSFVPARRARIGIADRIFTRVGASDSLATGESTFMVEMRETAAILREGTRRSLVLLDEIGRGTSTFDGLSIAWAVAEHLHDAPGLRARVLFATHYHELADLARTKAAVRNFHFTVAEQEGEILFLRRMEPGAASRSYGIDVARTAGLPPKVIRRAREVLRNLEGGEFDECGVPRLARTPGATGEPAQLGLFAPEPDPLHVALRALEPEHMTPLDALIALDRLKRLAGDGT
jgi:DNA mismatch repair protein MutS